MEGKGGEGREGKGRGEGGREEKYSAPPLQKSWIRHWWRWVDAVCISALRTLQRIAEPCFAYVSSLFFSSPQLWLAQQLNRYHQIRNMTSYRFYFQTLVYQFEVDVVLKNWRFWTIFWPKPSIDGHSTKRKQFSFNGLP